MAHLPVSYRVETKEKKNGEIEHILILYVAKEGEPEIIPSPAEQKQIDKYEDKGYTIKYETKALPKYTKEIMEKTLKEKDPEAYKEWNKLYHQKAVKGNKDFKETGYSKALGYYKKWEKKWKEDHPEEKAK